MKILFVDDDYKILLFETYKSIEKYYGKGNVFAYRKAEEALEFLETNSNMIDLALLDEKLIGDFSGLMLGKEITLHYPQISLVMLTGFPTLSRCQQAMRIGFCDFISKENVIDSQENLFSELKRIEILPSVQAKQKFKEAGNQIIYLSNELKTEQKKEVISNFDDYLLRDAKTIQTSKKVKKRLDHQETILNLVRDAQPKIRINKYSLAAGMMLLEKDVPIPVTIKMLVEELGDLKEHSKYELALDSYATLKNYFKEKEKGIYTKVALLVMGLFNQHPNQWGVTREVAKQRVHHENDFFTFIDEIIINL
jgi:ActR/RegA family two-component response regulator